MAGACGDGRSGAPPGGTPDVLLDPETCQGCHPDHYREWSGSMHAYAGEDPVFRAMNARGQRETGGALGDFCVRCHAPLAVRAGLTTDGLDLDAVPRPLRGVTCAFCHRVESVAGLHTNPLGIADDAVMRAGIADPMPTAAHESAYSRLHDRTRRDSSDLCGSCHDIVTPAGVHLERTFAEWLRSLFARDASGTLLTCGGCHMTGRDGNAAQVDGAPRRRVHEHTFAGVDVALSPWPETEAQRAAIARDLDPVLAGRLCVTPHLAGVEIAVTLDNVLAGHMWPSGAAQDRRAWVEVLAWAGEEVVWSSGDVRDDEAVAARAVDDPDLWVMRDHMLDDAGREVHMFWEARRIESTLLAPAVTNDPRDPAYIHAVTRTYRVAARRPDRVTMRVRLRPIDRDVLEELVASGDLAGDLWERVPTFTLAGTVREWRMASGFGCVEP
jgi:hypothetical protein